MATTNTFEPEDLFSNDPYIFDNFRATIQEFVSTLSLEDIEEWITLKTKRSLGNSVYYNEYSEWKFIEGLLSRYSNCPGMNELYVLVTVPELESARVAKARDNKIRQIND
jgi:hypothetical protein